MIYILGYSKQADNKRSQASTEGVDTILTILTILYATAPVLPQRRAAR